MWEASPLPLHKGGEMAIDDPKEAINYALEHAAEEDAVFIGGSNYLVGEALQMISDK